MISKIYDKLKNFIKENYKQLLFLVALFVFVNYPLNCTVMVSGGTIDINDRIEISSKTTNKGSFNMAYVTELKGTIPTVLLSYVIPSWSKVDLEEYQVDSGETEEDITSRSKVYLEYSKQSAIKTAFDKAGLSNQFKVNNKKFYVIYVDDDADTNVKTGDIILKVNNKKLEEMNDYKELVKNHKVGDKLSLVIDRKGKEIETFITVKNIDNEKITGISVLQLYSYETNPTVKLKFKENESGSSGGLMLSLAIYDKLTNSNLTGGKKIVGTGTIDFDGNVGEIDGVEYKLKGAVKAKADVFIAPYGDNYNDCVKLKKKYGYKIKIISAKTFDEAVSKLKNL